jgi:tRNA(fMet)-specific endonuclease VapC
MPFDAMAKQFYQDLRSQKLRAGKLDSRIAAIAFSQGATILTRNIRDFQQGAPA